MGKRKLTKKEKELLIEALGPLSDKALEEMMDWTEEMQQNIQLDFNVYVSTADKIKVFCDFLDSIKDSDLLNRYKKHFETQFLTLLESEDARERYNYFQPRIRIDYDPFFGLLEVAKGNGWIKKHFPTFMETIYKFSDEFMYDAFCKLINTIKETELMKENYSQIKTYFLFLWNYIDKLCICNEYEEKVNAFLQEEMYYEEGDDGEYYEVGYSCDRYHQQDAYSILIEAIKGTKLEKEINRKD